MKIEIIRAYKTELKPNNKQRTWLNQCAGTARFVYNWGLAEWGDWFFRVGIRPVSASNLKKFFNNLEKDNLCPWVRNYPYSITEAAFRNLGDAFKNFYRQRKDGTVKKRIASMNTERWKEKVAHALKNGKSVVEVEPGYPSFKRKGDPKSFQLKEFTVYDNRVELGRRDDISKIGAIRLKERGYIPISESQPSYTTYATVSEKAGRWYISVQIKHNIDVPQNDSTLVIGIDQGLKTRVVCSDGTVYEMPKSYRDAQREIARLDKEFKRRTPGGSNYQKTKLKRQRAYQKSANIRKHWLHQISHDIVVNKRPHAIVLEDLNVSGMMKNKRLAKSVGDAAFSELRRQIEYKAQEYGVNVVLASQWYPSSKLCRECGTINDDLTLSDRTWTCVCGAVHNRDLNAARNLAALAEP